jgi:hypothetical protein
VSQPTKQSQNRTDATSSSSSSSIQTPGFLMTALQYRSPHQTRLYLT